MITIRRTNTNSTPGLKAASCGKHPGRWRVHRGEPIKCFEKFDRKTTTTQEVKFVYSKQFEKRSNPHTIYNTLAHAAITRAKAVRINERTQPKRDGSHEDDWLTRGDDNTLRACEFSWTRPTPLPPPPHQQIVLCRHHAERATRKSRQCFDLSRSPIVTPKIWIILVFLGGIYCVSKLIVLDWLLVFLLFNLAG